MTARVRKIVVDSDVLIQVLRGDAAVAAKLRRCLETGTAVALTPISVAEVFAGMRPEEEARTRVFLGSLDCLRIDRGVGERAGRFLAKFAASHAVEMSDALIAACAAVHGYRLWTLNRKHYPMRDVRFFS